MVEVVTFQRLYADSWGIEYPAKPEYVANVIRSMNEHADGWDPFRVRLRMSDGSVVTVSPKRKRS